MPPQVIIGSITNHTHRLPEERIHELVAHHAASLGGTPVLGPIDNVHAAPAEDPDVLTKAVRAWRDQGEGRPVDFTQDVEGRTYWFGFHHEPEEE